MVTEARTLTGNLVRAAWRRFAVLVLDLVLDTAELRGAAVWLMRAQRGSR
jgi:hypothetical protein